MVSGKFSHVLNNRLANGRGTCEPVVTLTVARTIES